MTPANVEQRVLRRLGKRHAIGRFDASRTALVIIDMQNYYVAEGFPSGSAQARGIVPNINRMSSAIRAAGAKVIWVLTGSSKAMEFWPNHHIHNLSPENAARRIASLAEGGEGHRIYPELEVHPTDILTSKVMYSAMLPGPSSNLLDTLAEHGIDTLLIAGTKTNVCCESTARDAYMLDFRVAMLSDCTATSSDEEHAATLNTFQLFFGDVMNFDDVAARLEPPARPT
ncbi:isochorismatase family protein [Ramlibacter henchirensis]|uniref:isochorismatase family protein n=1 Tax=Ramlibacter henchirensis TaxID=204072 RepID=UPI0014305989|nr:cysteine hydrolase [Ramlibacter henchirensis]